MSARLLAAMKTRVLVGAVTVAVGTSKATAIAEEVTEASSAAARRKAQAIGQAARRRRVVARHRRSTRVVARLRLVVARHRSVVARRRRVIARRRIVVARRRSVVARRRSGVARRRRHEVALHRHLNVHRHHAVAGVRTAVRRTGAHAHRSRVRELQIGDPPLVRVEVRVRGRHRLRPVVWSAATMTADTMVMLVAISIADGTATLVVMLVATLVVTSIADGMAMLVATSIAGGTAMGVATLVGRIMTGEATVVGRTTGRISFENVLAVKAFSASTGFAADRGLVNDAMALAAWDACADNDLVLGPFGSVQEPRWRRFGAMHFSRQVGTSYLSLFSRQ